MTPHADARPTTPTGVLEQHETGSFTPLDWGLLAGTALTWGSSFVFIEVALEAFEPALIALLRVVFGAAALAWLPGSRKTVPKREWPALGALGLMWMALPFLLFPIAQRSIDSSVAGMINGAVPLFATVIAAVVIRRLPQPLQLVGLGIGFVGVVTVSWPSLQGADATARGVALVTLATFFYGVALNIAVPLQRRYGSLPVLLRSQLIAIVVLLIPGLVAATASGMSWKSLLAVVPLGCLGTGLAFVWMSRLAGRVGAARSSVTIYFVPLVAIVLGVGLRNEDVEVISLAGAALVLLGAYLTSRGQQKG